MVLRCFAGFRDVLNHFVRRYLELWGVFFLGASHWVMIFLRFSGAFKWPRSAKPLVPIRTWSVPALGSFPKDTESNRAAKNCPNIVILRTF